MTSRAQMYAFPAFNALVYLSRVSAGVKIMLEKFRNFMKLTGYASPPPPPSVAQFIIILLTVDAASIQHASEAQFTTLFTVHESVFANFC